MTKSQETADLVTFTREILNGKVHFLCSGCSGPLAWLFLKSNIKMLQLIKIFIFFRITLDFFSHCVKIGSYFWSLFSCIRIEYREIRTPYLDLFHAYLSHFTFLILSFSIYPLPQNLNKVSDFMVFNKWNNFFSVMLFFYR